MWVGNPLKVGNNQGIDTMFQTGATADGSQMANSKLVITGNGQKTVTAAGISLDISENGIQKLKQQEEQNSALLDMLQRHMDSMKEQEEAGEEAWSTYGKCLTIAIRISSGDNVPLSDMEYLKEHNMELYTQAMTLRMPKKDPKDYDSVLEDEEEDSESEESSGSVVETGITETASASDSVEAAAPAESD